ncbi:ankyrin repeat domain-containing protein 22 isoform 1-T2 [Menidia menidia]
MGLVYSEPACQAAFAGDLRRLYGVLRRSPAHLDVQEPLGGDTPLIAACRRGNLSVVKYLLSNGADATLTNQKRRTCLHYAARRTFSVVDYLLIAILMPILLLGYFILLQKQRRNQDLLEAVLSSAVPVDAVDLKGNTALHYACQRKSRRLVPPLLRHGARTDIQNLAGETPLDISVRLGFTGISSMLRRGC